MNSNIGAYADLIISLTRLLERNAWIMWIVYMLPLIPAVSFRSPITMFVVMGILAIVLLTFPIDRSVAIWLWLVAFPVSAAGGAFHLRYKQSERHHREMLYALHKTQKALDAPRS